MVRTVLLLAPTAEPVSVAEAKAHLRVEVVDDDALITGFLRAARDTVEGLTGRRLMPQKWRLVLDRFERYELRFAPGTGILECWSPDRFFGDALRRGPEEARTLLLPYAPLVSVEAVTVTDANNVSAAFDYVANCVLDNVGEPGRLVLKASAAWPTPAAGLAAANAVKVDFTVGYADAAAVPERLKLAIKLLAAHYYENREETTPLKLEALPRGVSALLARYRLRLRGAYP